MVLTDAEVIALRSVVTFTASLSVLGCSFIILSFLWFRSLRNFTGQLVFCLSLSDFSSAFFALLTWLLYLDDTNTLCTIQAFGIQISEVSSFLWSGCIAFHSYQLVCRKTNIEVLIGYLKYYLLLCYVLPVLISLIPFGFGAYGNAGHSSSSQIWCWITGDFPYGPYLRFSLFYGPILIVYLYILICYILIRREIYKLKQFISENALKNVSGERITLYLLIFAISKFPGLINRFQNIISDNPIFVLFLLQAIFNPLQGFANSIVYGMRKALRNEIRRQFCCENSGTEDPLVTRNIE